MTPTASLLAQTEMLNRIRGVREGFRHQPSYTWESGTFFWFLGALAVGLLGLLILMRWKRQNGSAQAAKASPVGLVNAALKELGVGLGDRILVWRLARRSRLPQPAVMFFSPALFDRYSRAWVNRLMTRPLRHYVLARLDGVAALAFVSEDAA